jgi:hypothetical protein
MRLTSPRIYAEIGKESHGLLSWSHPIVIPFTILGRYAERP